MDLEYPGSTLVRNNRLSTKPVTAALKKKKRTDPPVWDFACGLFAAVLVDRRIGMFLPWLVCEPLDPSASALHEVKRLDALLLALQFAAVSSFGSAYLLQGKPPINRIRSCSVASKHQAPSSSSDLEAEMLSLRPI